MSSSSLDEDKIISYKKKAVVFSNNLLDNMDEIENKSEKFFTNSKRESEDNRFNYLNNENILSKKNENLFPKFTQIQDFRKSIINLKEDSVRNYNNKSTLKAINNLPDFSDFKNFFHLTLDSVKIKYDFKNFSEIDAEKLYRTCLAYSLPFYKVKNIK